MSKIYAKIYPYLIQIQDILRALPQEVRNTVIILSLTLSVLFKLTMFSGPQIVYAFLDDIFGLLVAYALLNKELPKPKK